VRFFNNLEQWMPLITLMQLIIAAVALIQAWS
jgi:hypothetical protein